MISLRFIVLYRMIKKSYKIFCNNVVFNFKWEVQPRGERALALRLQEWKVMKPNLYRRG